MPRETVSRITVTLDRTKEVEDAIRKLANTRVMVGIPTDDEPEVYGRIHAEARDDNVPIGNAALGYIHEHGSPINNIPRRAFLVPGVSESRSQWIKYLEQAGRAALNGKAETSNKALHAAGTTAVSAVKKKIQSNIPPPLSQKTIDRRRQRSPGSRYRRKASSAGDVIALIDTAQMINSICYALRRVGRKP